MPRRRHALLTLAFVASCAGTGGSPGPRDRGPARPGEAALAPSGARWFQSAPEEAFWVTHDGAGDRVVASGARLALAPSGEVVSAAWERPTGDRFDALLGSLAVAPHLGGGFVHWTSSSLFRSSEFTGPWSPIELPAQIDLVLRGARNGPKSVVVMTETGPLALYPGAGRATPLKEAGLHDIAALDASLAVRLDVFSRAEVTTDGGATWVDASPFAGIALRAIQVAPDELALEGYQGRYVVQKDGTLGELESGYYRSGVDSGRAFSTYFKGTRATERETWPWGWRDTTPLQAAVLAGAALPDGTAFGMMQGVTARVDVKLGTVVSIATDWLSQSLQCQPVRVDDGVLFACIWDQYEGYGAYVLKSVDGQPPKLEHSFSDEGHFVADDHGAIAYVGSCEAKPRAIDFNDPSRFEAPSEPKPKLTVCVRRGAGEWVEREIDPPEGATMYGWVPRKDGSAVALVLAGDGEEGATLPAARGAPRVSDRGSVLVIRLEREQEGWYWPKQQQQRGYRGGRGGSSIVDKTFRAAPGGELHGWLTSSSESSDESGVRVAVTLDAEGKPTVGELPPDLAAMAATGDFGLAVTRTGQLFETLDHGLSWRAAGISPIAPQWFSGGCSALGCTLGGMVRLGWGDHGAQATVSESREAPADPPPPGVPRLKCAPVGAPIALPAPLPVPPGAKLNLTTSYGETVEIVRDASAPEPPPSPAASPYGPYGPYGLPAAPTAAPTSSASAGKPVKPTAPTLRTHTLIWRLPFDPLAEPRRLNATDASLVATNRRATATPLLAEDGQVALLIFADASELLVGASQVSVLPPFEQRRYMYNDTSSMTGLTLGPERALILADLRRRTTLEEHGKAPQPPPFFIGLERETLRRRHLSLARREDGATGVLVLDGTAPETAGIAEVDRRGAIVGPVKRLAPWSTLTAGDDPRCDRRRGWRALVVIDPAVWLALDPIGLPGATLGRQGLARVLWGEERVCLEGLDAVATDTRRRLEAGASALVARWSSGAGKGGATAAALRSPEVRQALRCPIESAGAAEPKATAQRAVNGAAAR
jgi:hypothetical protein